MGQILMRRVGLSELPEIRVPDGYAIRCCQPGDEPHLATILTQTFDEEWTLERVHTEFFDDPRFHPSRMFFAVHGGPPLGGTPVGTATAWDDPRFPGMGYLHYVGVLPTHRGHRLATVLSLRSLMYFTELGFDRAVLHTDDFRFPAVKTYLRLGFEPVIVDDLHEERWRRILTAIDRPDLMLKYCDVNAAKES